MTSYLDPIKLAISLLKEVNASTMPPNSYKRNYNMGMHYGVVDPFFVELGLKFIWIWKLDHVNDYVSALESYVDSLPLTKSDLPKIIRYKVYIGDFCLGTISSNGYMTVWTVAPNNYNKFQSFPIFHGNRAHTDAKWFYTKHAFPQNNISCIKVDVNGHEYLRHEMPWKDWKDT